MASRHLKMDKNFFQKKVAVLGFGLEGQDLVKFLLRQGAKITVFDQKEAKYLGKNFAKFENQGIKFILGQNCFKEGLSHYDFVFRSPGFSPLRPEIIEAKKRGVVISSATKIFFDLCPGKIIGVTGTKGKGTTSTLIYQILKNDGQDVFLGGNIGHSPLSFLPKIKPSSWVVLELSSFQLQDLEKSPHLAVVLFIAPEHLDYHHDAEEYFQAKRNIVRYQKENDLAVLNADNQISSSFAHLTPAQVYYFSRQKKVKGAYVKNKKIYLLDKEIGFTSKLQLLGKHNWDNICAAVTASWLVGADLKSIKKVIFSFQGLEHRLEFVKEVKGRVFYNDSFSTTPETTIAALHSFHQPLTLIAGGSEKGSDYQKLGEEIKRSRVKTLILIGEMAEKIRKAVLAAGFRGEIIFRPSKKMSAIVNLAFQKTKRGGVILLSPACASFDMFKNYKDRGLQFKRNVKRLS